MAYDLSFFITESYPLIILEHLFWGTGERAFHRYVWGISQRVHVSSNITVNAKISSKTHVTISSQEHTDETFVSEASYASASLLWMKYYLTVCLKISIPNYKWGWTKISMQYWSFVVPLLCNVCLCLFAPFPNLLLLFIDS